MLFDYQSDLYKNEERFCEIDFQKYNIIYEVYKNEIYNK